MIILIDHNIEGQAALLWSTLNTDGWLDLIPLQMVRFRDVGLDRESNDRVVWRFSQEHTMILLTANRTMNDDDALEIVMREENFAYSLPIITISSVEQMVEASYRERCATKLMEYIVYLENYRGVGRLFIP